MKRHHTAITTIIALSLAAAMQTVDARELPDSVKQFANEQHQEILVQGFEARRAIGYKLQTDFESQRMAFIETQSREILDQGRRALASIREELDPAGNGGLVAMTPPRRTETADWTVATASHPVAAGQ